jgi:hypothetical protein
MTTYHRTINRANGARTGNATVSPPATARLDRGVSRGNGGGPLRSPAQGLAMPPNRFQSPNSAVSGAFLGVPIPWPPRGGQVITAKPNRLFTNRGVWGEQLEPLEQDRGPTVPCTARGARTRPTASSGERNVTERGGSEGLERGHRSTESRREMAQPSQRGGSTAPGRGPCREAGCQRPL